MIVQGALETLMGIGYVVLGFTMPAMMALGNQAAQGGPQVALQQQMQTVLTLVYSIAGGIALIAGLLRIIAGIRGLYFRGHVLGIVSHFFGMLNVVTCYCLPTSLGLCIWGCMVYFNPEVKYAFRLGAEGNDPAEIEARMTGQPRH